jgi:hypothetical protein
MERLCRALRQVAPLLRLDLFSVLDVGALRM